MADNIMVTASEFTDGHQTHPVESEQWYVWLDSQNKFRYSDSAGTFTAYKQKRSGNFVWYGQKRRDGILRTQYLGKSEDLNKEVLHNICETLNLPKQDWLNRERKRATKSKSQSERLSQDERMILERERELRKEAESKLEKSNKTISKLKERVDILVPMVQNSKVSQKCETLTVEWKGEKYHINCETFKKILEILEDGLMMKANAGGAIKVAIRSAITLLKSDN